MDVQLSGKAAIVMYCIGGVVVVAAAMNPDIASQIFVGLLLFTGVTNTIL